MVTLRARPSKAHRWANGCSASIPVEATLPDTPGGPAAQEGSRKHDISANILKGGAVELDSEDAADIMPYVRTVRDTLAASGEGAKLHVEKRLDPLPHFPEMYGTPDARIWDPESGTLYIDDLKTGMVPVEAVGNLQLACYLMLSPEPWKRAVLRIIQPTTWHADGHVRVWEVDGEAFTPYRLQIVQAIQDARNGGTFKASPSNCRYCKALPSCKAARDMSLIAVSCAGSTPLQALPPEAVRLELDTLRDAMKALKLRLDAIEQETKTKLFNGQRVPGCRLAPGKAQPLRWDVPVEAVRAALGAITDVDVRKPVDVITPKQAIDAGVPESTVKALASRAKPKLSVKTDEDQHLKRMFPK